MPRTKHHRRYFYDRVNRVKYLLDDYGEPYYALDEEDDTMRVSLTIPKSLKKIVDDQRGSIPFARFVRKAIEKHCGVKRI